MTKTTSQATRSKGTSPATIVVPSRGSQSTPPEPKQVGVEGSTTLMASQHARDGADPHRSSSGHNTTTISQKKQTEETLVNDGTAASESQPAPPPEQVGVKGSTTLKASQRASDGADPPRSSSGHNTTTISQKKQTEETLVNDGTATSESQPALPKAEDSTAKSHSEADTLKASQRALHPHSSGGHDTTIILQKKLPSTEPEDTLANDGTTASESQPTPPGQVEVEDSTVESHPEVDTSKVSQRALHPHSSGGHDTTTISQKKLSEETLANEGTGASESQPASPEQAEDSSVKPRADTSDPTQSSTGLGTTTIPQTEPHTTEPKRTQMGTADIGTPSPAKISDSDSLKNQSNNTDVSAQASRSTSGDVKDHTVSGQLASHAPHSDHQRNGDVMDQNEKSSTNPSQPCEGVGASTPSIKEKTGVPQKEELSSTESANKQKASDPAQAEDGQATTSSMEGDVDQPLAKCEEDIRGLKAKISSMERLAQQQAGERKEESERLEAKISSLEKIVDQQKQEHKYFKARIPTVDEWLSMRHGVNTEHKREIERPEEKQEKEIQRLEAIVVAKGKQTPEIERLQALSSTEHVAEHKQEIERLEDKEVQGLEAIIVPTGKQTSKEIERLQKISSMEQEGKHDKEIQRLEEIVVAMGKQTTEKIEHLATEHKQGLERLEGKHNKEIQLLEEIVVAMGKQTSEEIERLQPKVSSEEGAKQLKTKQARRDLTKNPDEKPIDSSQPPQTQVAKHSSTVANQKIDGSDQESRIKKEQNKSLSRTSASGKQANITPPQAVTHKADSLSVTDVANLVKALNAEIGQVVDHLTESLPKPEPPASDIAFDELHNYLGPWLCDKLRENSEPGSLITQLALQTGLANACSSVVNDLPFWCDGSILQALYNRMAEEEGQAAADKWRAKTSNCLGHLDLPQFEDANKKYLTEVLLKLATAAVGGTLKSNESLLFQYNPQVEVIAKMAAKLQKTITEDVTSSELITFTVPCDTEFDASQMEDTENNHVSTPHGKVVCTHDMGLLCRKRGGSLKDWGMTMKAKVVLAATLEG